MREEVGGGGGKEDKEEEGTFKDEFTNNKCIVWCIIS